MCRPSRRVAFLRRVSSTERRRGSPGSHTCRGVRRPAGFARPATWVVAAGDSLPLLLRQTALPAHVIIAERIPQVRLLARAALMITHGGSNSVRECLHFGVPMLVFPRWFDQYGIGARVRFHGLGLVGDPRRATPSGVERQVRRLLGDPAYAERAGRMRQHVEACAQPDLAVSFIEEWMGARLRQRP